MQARVGRKLIDQIEALPQAVRDIAWKGQLRTPPAGPEGRRSDMASRLFGTSSLQTGRMCQRYRHMMAAGKTKVVAITAIAREMVGFIRAIAREVAPASA